MDLRQIEQAVKDSKGGITEKKEVVAATLVSPETSAKSSIDSGKALQLFLDHVPISSIPDFIINNPCPEFAVKTTDSVGYAIQLLYDKNVCVALIVDKLDSNLDKRKSSEESIGLIDLASMILWFLKEYDHCQAYREDNGGTEITVKGFFSMLERNPPIAQTKVGELAKLFLWDPFFPIHMDDSLFRVLLLFSKHQLQVVAVTEKSNCVVSGFVSKRAVIRALLESSGLEWFDSIADKALSEFRFGNERAVQIYGDQSMVEAIQVLWENKIGSIAVVELETKMLIGSVRSSDIFLLLEDDGLYRNRKNLKVEQFIQLDATRGVSDSITEGEVAALSPSRRVHLQNSILPRMISPVTSRKTDSLNKAMKQLVDTQSNFSFLIDEYNRVQGLITLSDIMVQFTPPCMDSRINGGCFFKSALEQTGCHVEGGTIVCDQH